MAEKTAEEGVTRQGTQTRGWDLASQEGTSPVPEQDAEPGGMPPGPRPRAPSPGLASVGLHFRRRVSPTQTKP